MIEDFDKLMGKYALLLTIFYLGNSILSYFGLLNGVFLLAYFFATNFVIAMTVRNDLKKKRIKSPITIWSCLFFHILGVTLFFIQIIKQEKLSKT